MINGIEGRKESAVEALKQLLCDSKTRPFLFRTRFERTMLRLQSVAREMGNKEIEIRASDALRKMRSIVDKSNSTPDGVLRSFIILEPDIKYLLVAFE